MTAQAMICPACHRKIRQGHQYCPHCEQRLPPGPPALQQRWGGPPGSPDRQPGAGGPSELASPPTLLEELRTGRSRWTGAALAGASALVSIFFGAQTWRNEAPVPDVPAPPAENVTAAARTAPTATNVARPTTNATDAPPVFLDVDRAGNLAYRNARYEDALAHYQQAIEKNPNDAESHSNLGQVLVRFGRAREAVPHFERAIELSPTRWAYHFNLAYAWGQLGSWPGAVAEYREAARIFPEDYATQYNLGRALHESGDEAGAVAAYRRAIELAPTEPTFHLSLGLSYERLARQGDAQAAYARYLELAPDAADAEKVRAHLARLAAPASPETPTEDPAGRPPQAN